MIGQDQVVTDAAPASSQRRRADARAGRVPLPWRLRVWLWLLTPGWIRQSEAAELRGWERVVDWREARPKARVRLLLEGLIRPFTLWRTAGLEIDLCGAEIREMAGVPLLSQRWHMWWLGFRHGMRVNIYRGYSFFRPERRRRAPDYVQVWEYFRVVRWYNTQHADNDAAVLMDKIRYVEWCRARGLPTIDAVVEYARGALTYAAAGDPVASLPAGDLFSKPSEGTGGAGTQRWRYVGDGLQRHLWADAAGREHTPTELLEVVANASLTLGHAYSRDLSRVLVQPFVRNHPALLSLTTGALCTVRVVTYREPGGPARALFAAYRMATGQAVADNFSSGGIVAPVDMATGQLQPGIRFRGKLVVPVDTHPDTGTRFVGLTLPYWKETLEIAERGLDLAKRLPSIGWDIAITEHGPVLIEANPASHPGIMQRATGIPMSDTPLAAAINAHVRTLFRD